MNSTRIGGALLGLIIGTAMGALLTIIVFVAQARFGVYLFSLHDILDRRWEHLPTVAGLIFGAIGGWRDWKTPPRTALFSAVLASCAAIPGWFLGALFWPAPSGPWAGAVIAAGIAIVGVVALAIRLEVLRSERVDAHRQRRSTTPWIAVGAVALLPLLNVTCSSPELTLDVTLEPVAVPDSSEVEQVVFLLGDGGAAGDAPSPVLTSLQREIREWAEAGAEPVVVYPGDLVYPVGIRDRDHPDFATDSARLWAQIRILGGTQMRPTEVRGVFVAGNHDWGNATGPAGLERLRNLEAQMELARASGYRAELHPAAGEPGPSVVDVGTHLRLVLIDVHWFLQDQPDSVELAFFSELGSILREADRTVMMVAHHPFRSGGPHGTFLPGPEMLGIPFLAKQTGALVQDLDSPAYAEFRQRLEGLFRADGPPEIFAAGHDHSLQVLEAVEPGDPPLMLVSGSGSKTTPVASAPGIRFGASRPGYMMLTVAGDGEIRIFVRGGDPRFPTCPTADPAPECMRAALDSMTTRFSLPLPELQSGSLEQR